MKTLLFLVFGIALAGTGLYLELYAQGETLVEFLGFEPVSSLASTMINCGLIGGGIGALGAAFKRKPAKPS